MTRCFWRSRRGLGRCKAAIAELITQRPREKEKKSHRVVLLVSYSHGSRVVASTALPSAISYLPQAPPAARVSKAERETDSASPVGPSGRDACQHPVTSGHTRRFRETSMHDVATSTPSPTSGFPRPESPPSQPDRCTITPTQWCTVLLMLRPTIAYGRMPAAAVGTV